MIDAEAPIFWRSTKTTGMSEAEQAVFEKTLQRSVTIIDEDTKMTTDRQARIDHYRQSQPISELRRKATKACMRKGKLWTAEEIDLAWAEAGVIAAKFGWLPEAK